MFRRFTGLLAGVGYIIVYLVYPDSDTAMLQWLGGFVLLLVIANLIVFRPITRVLSDYSVHLLPPLWVAASSAVLFGVTPPFLRLMLAIAAALILIQVELRMVPGRTSAFIENVSFLTATGLFYGIWITEFIFAFPWWIPLIAVFLISVPLFWLEFYPTPSRLREKLLFTFLLAYSATGLAWTLLYWPVHYLTLTAFFMGAYYLAAILCRFYLAGSLTRNKVIFHALFFVGAEALILATAQWLPKI